MNRTNCDFELLADYALALHYVTKYVTKPEVASECFLDILDIAISKSINDRKKVMQKLVLKTFSNREISGQEVAIVL